MNSSSFVTARYRWAPACALRVTGSDAAAFLQGQFTNDLRVLDAQPAVYGLWLNVKGKVLADSFVVRGANSDEFWVFSYYSPAAVIRERLESHVIADDVTIDDATGEWTGVSLFAGAAGADDLRGFSSLGFCFAGRRARSGEYEWLVPVSSQAEADKAIAGIAELATTELLRMRIEQAIPAVPHDIGPADLPNEAGLDDDAISYTKGCYLGQEVMARLKSMGQVRRKLVRVRGQAALPSTLPAPLFARGRQVGELRSAVTVADGWVGLAMVTLMHVSHDTGLSFAAEGPGALRVTDTVG